MDIDFIATIEQNPIHTIALLLLLLATLSKKTTLGATLATISLTLASIMYFHWRWTSTLGNSWHYVVFAVEIISYLYGFIYLVMTINFKNINRSIEADIFQQELFSRKTLPSVDVYIPTYNEPENVLLKTIVGAKNLDYPNFKVHVLDDGKRDWLKELCQKIQVNYIRREENTHAKAGNMNHALSHTSGEFIAVLDADFVAFPNFLKRTIGFFADEKIAIVQTPQFFYNLDPLEYNSKTFKVLGDEQRLWFDDIIVARDRYNLATSCGTCSVNRRDAIESIGGFPVETITEDYDSSIQLLEKGLITRYLNERLSVGLAAENMEGFITQRKRWATGNLTVWKNHLKRRKTSFPFWYYIVLFDWYYMISVPSKLFMAFIPLLFLYFGIMPMMINNLSELVLFHWVFIFVNCVALNIVSTNKFIPIISNAVSYTSILKIFPAVLNALLETKLSQFKVTPKGVTFKKQGKESFLIMSLMRFLSILLVFGVIFATLNATNESMNGVIVAGYWALITSMALWVGQRMVKDSPRYRKEERFEVSLNPTMLSSIKNKPLNAQITNISLGGFVVKGLVTEDCKVIQFENIEPIEAKFIGGFSNGDSIYSRFAFKALTIDQSVALIRLIFQEAHIPTRKATLRSLKLLW